MDTLNNKIVEEYFEKFNKIKEQIILNYSSDQFKQ